MKNPPESKPCKGCGKQFEFSHNHQLYCTTCKTDGTKARVQKEEMKAYHREWWSTHYIPKEKFECSLPKRIKRVLSNGNALDEFDRLAKEAGLSYGHYAARMEREKGRAV